jgi:hypothetical protein
MASRHRILVVMARPSVRRLLWKRGYKNHAGIVLLANAVRRLDDAVFDAGWLNAGQTFTGDEDTTRRSRRFGAIDDVG